MLVADCIGEANEMEQPNPTVPTTGTYFDRCLAATRKPDFSQFLRVLERKAPDRPTLFEFFLNDALYGRLTGDMPVKGEDGTVRAVRIAKAYARAGYDYVTLHASSMEFPTGTPETRPKSSLSMNAYALIEGREDLVRYEWPDVDAFGTPNLDAVAPLLPDGMKLVAYGPGGVLENMEYVMGYENLCYQLADDPKLVAEVADGIGSRLLRYYELAAVHPAVGACIVNDDWGFRTQTLLSVEDLRRLIFPWHKRMVRVIHDAGKPAILHSCGQLEPVMDDIIDDMGFDAKHSYEDAILPVEQVYDRYSSRIAILGGIDVDFICRSSPDAVYERARRMLAKTGCRGYALGSGNSIPYYVPDEGWAALVCAALED
jgi:uroporphyrinogen decarboxylase